MTRIATKRAILLQAWRAAQRRIDRDGVTQLASDEEAGRLLHKYESALAAHTLCKLSATAELLAEVVKDEGGIVLPGRNAS